ncbi:hypothetical protein E05_39140 [Plautia stali symbiont]|nr:hypothetical protein E05_39140 [Plautia stali symbiont]
MKIAQDQLTALSKIGDLARQRNEEGAASLSDATQTDARIEGARTTLTQYQASLNRWRATLASYLGWPLVKKVSDAFPPSLTRACAVGKADDKTNPAVLAAWAQARQAANAAVNSARLKAQQQLSESQTEALSLSQSLAIMSRKQTLGEKTQQLYQDQYLQLGTRPLLDVLNAEQEVFQTRFAMQQTISQLRSLQLDCLYSTGQMRSAFALNNQRIQSVEIQP